MGAVNTNSISLATIREEILGQLPETGTAEYLEPNDISGYGVEITTVARNPISMYRMNKKGTITDVSSSVSFTQDTTASLLLQFLEGGIYSTWMRRPFALRGGVSASTADGGYVLTEALAGAPVEGSIIFVRGFVNQANNGLKVVGAGSTTTLIVTTDGASLVDEVGGEEASLFAAGFQATAGDIQIDAVGNIISTTMDFTSLGLEVGQGIFIGGLGDDTKFDTEGNCGLCRVRNVEANRITVDKRPQTWVADAGAGKTIHMYVGWFIKDVAVNHPLFKEWSFAFEAAYPGIQEDGSDGYEYSTGNVINTMEISLPLSDKSETSITTYGMDTLPITGTRQPYEFFRPLFMEAYSTPNDFIRLRVEKADETGLSTLFKECTLTLSNNAGGENVLGKIGPAFTNFGNFDVTVAFTCIFTSLEIPKMIRNNCTCSMDFCIVNNDAGFYFDIPSITLGDGTKDFAVNEKVKISLSSTAFGDPDPGYTLGVTFFPYLPNPKADACA